MFGSGLTETRSARVQGRIHLAFLLGGALIVLLAGLWQITADKQVTRFHPDESRWINRAQHLTELSNPLGSYWADAYLIRGQPPMGSYLTGIGLALQGYDLDSSGPWNFSYGNDSDINWNVTYGNVPSGAYLMAARNMSIAVGLLTCLTVYLIVTVLTNWVGGTVAGVFMGVHPLTVYLSTLAVSDAAFTFFAALSVLAAIWLAREPGWWRALVLAVILGIGASLKLSPMFVAAGLAAIGGLIIAGPVAERVRPLRWIWNYFGANAQSVRRLGWMLIAMPMIAVTFFLASYPYLWPDPVGRTKILLEFRRDEMNAQARIWAPAAIDSRIEALDRTWDTLEYRYSATGKFLVKMGITERRSGEPNRSEPGYDVPFAVAGLALFAVTALRRGFRSPHLLAFLTLTGQAGIIVLGLRVDFDRYYLPMVLACAVGLGVGVGQVTSWLVDLAVRRSRWTGVRGLAGVDPARAD